jgi:hypothetical protein
MAGWRVVKIWRVYPGVAACNADAGSLHQSTAALTSVSHTAPPLACVYSYKKCGPEMLAAGLELREFGDRAVIVIREPFRAIWSDFQRGILLNARTDHHVMKVNRSALLGNEFLWNTCVHSRNAHS